MVKKKTEIREAQPFDRYFARGLDLIVISILALLLSLLSGFWAFIITVSYTLLMDAIPLASLGKDIVNLQVVDKDTGHEISYIQSILRNLPFGLYVACALIPIWGWILMMLVGVPILILEAYLLYNTGERLGDIIAHTKVVEIEPILKSFKSSSLNQNIEKSIIKNIEKFNKKAK